MANLQLKSNMGSWTTAYGVANATYRVFDGSGDEAADAYEVLETGQQVNTATPFGDLVQGGVLKGGQSARLEDNYDIGRNWKRAGEPFPGLAYQPGTARHKKLDRTASNDGASSQNLNIGFPSNTPGQVAGYLTLLGARLETPDTGQSLVGVIFTSGISGTPAEDSKYDALTFVDCRNVDGWDHESGTGRDTKWGFFSWRTGSFIWEGGSLTNIRYEHSFYMHYLRGPHRIRNHEAARCGRTSFQLLSRSVEEDGRRGTGTIVIEDMRVRDVGLEGSGEGAHPMTLRSRHEGRAIIRRSDISQGNDPRITPSRFVDTTGGIVQAWGEYESYNENGVMVPSEELVIDDCGVAVGFLANRRKTPVQFEGSTKRFTLSRSSIITYEAAGNGLALTVVAYVEKDQASNYREVTLEKWRCDIRNIIIGKVVFDDGDVRREYPDFDMDGSGFAAFLADPEIQSHPLIELFDSGSESSDISVTAAANSHHEASATLTIIVAQQGQTAEEQTLEISANTVQSHVPTAFPLEITLPSVTAQGQHRATAILLVELPEEDQEIRVLGVANGLHEASAEVTIEFVGGSQTDPLEIKSRASHTASAEIFFEVPEEQGDEANLVLDLLPVGLAWPRAERASVRWKLTKAWSEFLLRIVGRAKDLAREADPRAARETLGLWKQLFGMPRPCMAGYSSLGVAERAIVVGLLQLHGRGGTTASKLEEICALFGFTVSIEERQVRGFRCGVAVCGDRLVSSSQSFVFYVHAPKEPIRKLKTPFRCGDRLGVLGGSALRCILEDFKPAHTACRIIYDLEEPCDWDDNAAWVDGAQWETCTV